MRASSKDHPIVSLTVNSPDGDAAEHLQRALSELTHFDPTVRVSNPSAGHFVLAGRRVAQLQVICDRIRDELHLAIQVSAAKAVLLETIRRTAEAEGKYIRQSGGRGNYGHCWLLIEPRQPSEGYQFTSEIRGGEVPNEYIRPIEEGVLGAMESGILAGYPIVDVKVTLSGGSYHEADSNELAFRFAGSIAFKEAAKKAFPVLLEPVMTVEVTVPEEQTGTAIVDINSRRGRIGGMELLAGSQLIKAIVPLSELLGSRSGGLAEFPMEFAGYEEVHHRGGFDGTVPGVPAILPKVPNQGRGSIAARHESETE